MASHPRIADGSSPADAPERVTIDLTADEHYRYRCPRGHCDWRPTNSHLWCRSCRRQADQGEEVDPEWYKLVDDSTGQEIPWSAVELVTRPARPSN